MAMNKPSTRASDTYRINAHVRPLLGRKKLSQITTLDIENFRNDVATGAHVKRLPSKADVKRLGLPKDTPTRKRTDPNPRGGKGASTRTMIVLSAMFSYAIHPLKILSVNPCEGVKKFSSKMSLRHLSMVELERVGVAMQDPELNPKAVAIILVLMLSGARKSEIQKLRRTEVDAILGFLKLDDSKTGQKIIHIGVAAVEILAYWMARSNSEWVFPSDDPEVDGPFVGVPKVWNKIRVAAGVEDVRLHDLRHTFASIGLAAGNTLAVIGGLFGHKDPKTTARYAHLTASPMRDTAEQVSSTIVASLHAQKSPPQRGDAGAGSSASHGDLDKSHTSRHHRP